MRYDYKLTYKDFLDAQRLFRKQRWKSALSYYVFIWGLPVLGFLAAVPWLAQLLGAQAQWVYAWGGFAALGLWCAIAIPLMRIYTIRRCWKRLLPDSAKKSIRSEIRVELEMNGEQLISALPGRSEGRFLWSGLIDYAEDEELALVFIKKKMFLFIPRRAMDDAGWNQLRSHFAQPRIPSQC